MNLIDKVVSFFDPAAGVRRMEARALMQQSMRNAGASMGFQENPEMEELANQLETARQMNQRLYNIGQYDPTLNPTAMLVGEPDKDIIGSINTAKKLVRDRMMNDPQAFRLVEVFCDGIHGEGIVPYADAKISDIDEKERIDAMVSNCWAIHMETTGIDVNGIYDYNGLCWMAENEKACGGGVLWIDVWNNKRDVLRKGLRHPYQVDVRSDRWLHEGVTSWQAKDKNGQPVGEVYPVIGGIEIDPKTKEVRACHLHERDPYDGFTDASRAIRIPAKYFVYDAERAQLGQIRGWPIMASIVPSLQHLDDLASSAVVRAKLDTAMSVILGVPMTYQRPGINGGENSDSFAYGSTNGDLPADGSGLPVNAYGVPQSFIKTGMISRVHKGTDVNIVQPQPSNVYQSAVKNSERRLAMAVSQTYEDVSGDYSGASFIFGRLARAKVKRAMSRRQWNFKVTVGDKIWKNFITGCYTMNTWQIPGYPEYPSFEQIKPGDVRWVFPVLDSADPLGEARADQINMRIGRLDPIEMIRRSGRDPEEVFRGYKKSYDMAAKYGINLDRFIFSGDGTNLEAGSGLIDGTVNPDGPNQ